MIASTQSVSPDVSPHWGSFVQSSEHYPKFPSFSVPPHSLPSWSILRPLPRNIEVLPPTTCFRGTPWPFSQYYPLHYAAQSKREHSLPHYGFEAVSNRSFIPWLAYFRIRNWAYPTPRSTSARATGKDDINGVNRAVQHSYRSDQGWEQFLPRTARPRLLRRRR